MSKNAKLEKKQGEKHNHKARQLMMQYVITLGVCIGSLALFVILSILQLLTANLYPSIATKLISPSTISKSSPINIGLCSNWRSNLVDCDNLLFVSCIPANR